MTSTNSNQTTPLTQWIKSNWVYLFFGLSVAIFLYTRWNNQPKRGEWVQLTYTTYHTPLGWGYDVLMNDSLFIHQMQMPAVQGTRGFSSEEDAARVANLVIDRMKKKQLPTIYLRDLDSLKIPY
ncbi:MAG: DUF4907 domain-containing protein [Bacteroidota bacterium]|jgi:hypothetical protein